jgi:hypothetical protein
MGPCYSEPVLQETTAFACMFAWMRAGHVAQGAPSLTGAQQARLQHCHTLACRGQGRAG